MGGLRREWSVVCKHLRRETRWKDGHNEWTHMMQDIVTINLCCEIQVWRSIISSGIFSGVTRFDRSCTAALLIICEDGSRSRMPQEIREFDTAILAASRRGWGKVMGWNEDDWRLGHYERPKRPLWEKGGTLIEADMNRGPKYKSDAYGRPTLSLRFVDWWRFCYTTREGPGPPPRKRTKASNINESKSGRFDRHGNSYQKHKPLVFCCARERKTVGPCLRMFFLPCFFGPCRPRV